MESSPLNRFPMEVLTMCFDNLEFREQLAVMSTCKKWYHILSDNRYLQHRRLNLSMDNICNPDGLWLEKMQRYRAFGISRKLHPAKQETQYFDAVRAFLSRTEVMNEVEDLLLSIDRMALDELFVDSQEWYFPKLKKINYLSFKHYGYKHTVVLNAPNLTQLSLTDWEYTVSPWVRSYSNQIQELNMNLPHDDTFFKTIEVCTLTNLRSLTLTVMNRSHDYPTQYHPHDTFSQLKYLKVCDIYNVFMGFQTIFHTAVNLETLIIIGKEMSSDAYNKIGNMQQLKKLCLLVNIISYRAADRLSLPNLESLTTTGTFAPLESVPKLKQLCIKDHSMVSMDIMNNTSHKYLRLLSRQLESLHLINVTISARLIESLRECIHLKSLTLRCINITDDKVCRIVRELPNLRNVCLVWCLLMKMPRAIPERMWAVRMGCEEIKALFRELRREHPRKSIQGIDNTKTAYSKHYSDCFVDYFI